MRLLKYVSLVAFPVILLGILLAEIGFKEIGFKLFIGGGMAVALVVGISLFFSIGTDYNRDTY